MTMTRTDAITARFVRWLDRYQPRKDLRAPEKAHALQDELNALLRVVLKAAPQYAFEAWLEEALERVDLTMTTSAWPATGQLAAALATPQAPRAPAEERPELREHPVARLIASGAVRSEREARWLRHDLTPEQSRRAREQRPCREEWDHHVTVMARFGRFQGLTRDQVERICAYEISPGQLPEHLTHLGNDVAPPPPAGYTPAPFGQAVEGYPTSEVLASATKRFPEPPPRYQPSREELMQARYRAGTVPNPPPPADYGLVPDHAADYEGLGAQPEG